VVQYEKDSLMSFFHYTVVGHFDPRTVARNNLAVARPVDPERVAALLAEYPAEVAAHVSIQNGCVHCQWATPLTYIPQVYEFAYRLARQEQCLAVENGTKVEYPPAAARAQGESWENSTGKVGLADLYEKEARRSAEAFDRRRRD
jgi:hypothetical protein